MKSVLIIFCTCLITTHINAQVFDANDSVNLAVNNTQMVYYQLYNGAQTSTSNTDWHLAITVRPTQFPSSPLGGTTIRINEGNNVKAYYVPNSVAADFNTLDTSGWNLWPLLHDSDTNIDMGALNSNRSANIFDFGWGVYNSATHNVTGDSLYLIQLPNGQLKKFLVVNLDKDTAFNLKYANIDNSDLRELHISKKDYLSKQFVYLDMATDSVRDKEPVSSAWDLQFHRYAALDVIPGTAYAVVGVWVNKGTRVAKVAGVNLDIAGYGGSYTTRLNGIGYDWKSYDQQNNAYKVQDSLVYFVQANNGFLWKLIFRGYGGNTTGITSFYKEQINMSTAIEEATNALLEVFPNPAANNLTVVTNAQSPRLTLTNLNGQVALDVQSTDPITSLNVADLPTGVYLLKVVSSGRNMVKKVVIQ